MSFLDPTKPLGLPEGSVRALMAIGITAAVITYAFVKGELPQEMGAAWTLIVGLYFGKRDQATGGQS